MSIPGFKHLPILTFLLLCSHLLLARQTPATDSILLRYAANTDMERSSAHYQLIRFKETPAEKTLRHYGLVKPLSRYHYILQHCPTDTALLKKINWCVPANDNWKASDLLLQQLESLPAGDSLVLQVSYSDEIAFPQKVRVIHWQREYHVATLHLLKQDWPAFIATPSILFADIPRHAKTELILNTANPYINRINIAQQQFPAVRGKSITVSVKEDLFDTTDIDIAGRYIPNPHSSNTITAHATTMATLIGGAGNSGALGLGAAPQASLSSADFNISLLPDTSAYYRQYNVTVQNHSYGTDIENYYGAEAVAYDQQIFSADTIVHVFSSGNIGTQAPTSGRYQGLAGYANMTGNFKQAKNVIVVGGVDATGTAVAIASKGPAFDGRIKPEIVAFGQDGTSDASALGTGVVTMMQDLWRQQHNGNTAAAALIKAVLINSAQRPYNVPPSYAYGFGNMHALHALQTLQQQRFRQGTLQSNQNTAFDITVPPGMQQVKVTLCWNDPPAIVNANKALINDLDLQVTAGGQTYLPWILSTFPSADSLKALARRGVDSINNTEQVSINMPAAGNLHINVQAKQLATANQTFYIVYEFTPLNTFQWQNPAPGAILRASQSIPLQWETTYSGNGSLSYSLDSGTTWIPIISQVPAVQQQFNWLAPNVFSKAWLKFNLPDTAFISPSFIISPALTMHTGFNCNDSALLYWNAQPGAAGYQLYTLNQGAMALYQQTKDTFVFIPKREAPGLYYAVNAVAPAGWAGLRSYTINYTTQGVACYVQSLLADKTTDNKVLLSLTLGSVYKLKNVNWQRLQNGQWQTLSTVAAGGLNYNYTDDSTWEGLLYYRVLLETTDGIRIPSDPVTVEIIVGNSILLFPNPATTAITILDPHPQARQLVISDGSGRRVILRNLSDSQETIPVRQLASGIYYCTIYADGKRIFSRKFIKM
ncbi:S8 family serine peptidase [Chitinophaga vietnamensis]|uniref:S8 family serine peptidase n=1 Tax=Chitinophaga vietnamensis TaxID=2593957 RepID=UPI001177E126|nr:S8 family serine peptidase [Chitinophaga vietnamensis]